MEKFDLNDFDEIYKIMEQSFPKDEFRPKDKQLSLLKDERYSIFGVREGGKIISFAAIWMLDGAVFIEHLATLSKRRGEGIGSNMLRDISVMFPLPICLEVEPPQDEMTRRRIEFYRRCAMHLNEYPYIQPALAKDRSPVPLLIMTSGSEINEATFKKLKADIYKHVYKIES